MQQQPPPEREKILRWEKASQWPAKLIGERAAKTNYGRHLMVNVLKDGTIDWRNRQYEDEKIEYILLEATEEISAPAASPVMDAVELNIVDPETTDERTYRKLSEWYLKQLRECQEEMRKLKACTPPPIEPGEQKTLTLETRTSAYYELKEGLGVDNIHPKNMPGEQKSGIPEEIRQWIESMSESIWQREGAIMEPGELATKVAHALYHKLMEEMPQTENPQASYWFEKARECLVERNDFKAQLMRAEQKIKELQDWHDSHV
jgi:hypothetical protein